MAFYLEDIQPIAVGDRLLPGKFFAVHPFNEGLHCSARWISWENKVSISGWIRLPGGLTLLWGDAARGEPYETRVLARMKPFRLDKDLTQAEIDEITLAYEAEAAHDAWLEMRAEQGWYDL